MALLRWLIAASGGHWSGDQFRFCFVLTGWLSVPAWVITAAVRWYLRYGLSYRDVEDCRPSVASPSTT